MKPKVTLEPFFHRDQHQIAIRFDHSGTLDAIARSLPNRKWSQTHRTWYVPNEGEALSRLLSAFGDKAIIDHSRLEVAPAHLEAVKQKPADVLGPLSDEAATAVKAMMQWMRSRRYSESTVGTYSEAVVLFLRYYSARSPKELGHEEVIAFNNNYIIANRLSASYQNQFVNAVKLFYKVNWSHQMDPSLIHRPKRAKVLPNVLNKEEIKKILDAPSNLKHRSLLSLVYACGLRRSEVLQLKLNDLDRQRGLLVIRQAKGKKDRIVPLSGKLLQLLDDYQASYHPKVYLFEGQSGDCYDESSLANVLRQALQKAGITKPVTLHWLRHSYATHLLENGTDLRYIQELLGHSSSRTTEIYTHVSSHTIQKIRSPFDSL